MNKGTYTGRFVSDPTVTKFADRSKVSFRLAVDRNYKDSEGNRPTDFLDFQAWGQRADLIEKHFKKGDAIVIADASARSEHWVDKETEEKKSRVIFEVNEIEFHPANPKGKGGKNVNEENVDEDQGEEDVKPQRTTPKKPVAKREEAVLPPKKKDARPKRKPWEDEDGDE